MRFNILPVDTPTPWTGLIWPREIVTKALEDFKKKISNGAALVTTENTVMNGVINLNKVVGRITDMGVDEIHLWCEIEFFDSPFVGNFSRGYRAAPRALGESTKKRVTDIEFICIDLLPSKK